MRWRVKRFERFPENSDIAMQRLQARAPGESIRDAWAHIPQPLQSDLKLLWYRATALRDEQDSGWHEVVSEALRLYPGDPKAKVLQAEGILERLLKIDPSAVGCAGDEAPTQDELILLNHKPESVRRI
jgi:hypothetical protein